MCTGRGSKQGPLGPKSDANVAFNPIIMAPPSDYSTIYTTLKRTKECVNALGQSEVPVYFDMGLLTKALEITWAKPVELQGVIPCEGGMHLLCAFCRYTYMEMQACVNCCLSQMCLLKAVCSRFSLEDFERALRGFKLVDEALKNRFLVQFKRWCETNGNVIPEDSYQVIGKFNEIFSSQTREADMQNENMFSGMNEKGIKDLQDLLEEFEQYGRSISPTFQFWHDFLKHVMLPMKLFIASSRLGVWEVNQYTKAEFLPLLFATNRSIYSKYMSYMILQMKHLPDDVMDGFQ